MVSLLDLGHGTDGTKSKLSTLKTTWSITPQHTHLPIEVPVSTEVCQYQQGESVLHPVMYEDCVKALSFGHDICLLGNEELRNSSVEGLQCLIVLRGRGLISHAFDIAISNKPFIKIPAPPHFLQGLCQKS